MFSMLKSLAELADDTLDTVTAPIEIGLDTAHAAVKPVANTARDIRDDAKRELKDADV